MARAFTSGFFVFLLFPSLAHSQIPTVFRGEEKAPAARGRLVVKYAPSVTLCAQRILAESGRFEAETGSPSLDQLNAELGVKAARPLAIQRRNLRGAQATAAYFDRHVAVRARFPQRAARAPIGAQAPDLSNLYVVEIDPKLDVYEAARLYRADPAVVYAEPDYEVRAAFVPDDPFFSSTGTWGQSYEDLWGLHRTDVATAWDVATGEGMVVAVVDTGIDLTHPDLLDNVWANGAEVPDNEYDDDANGFVDDVVGWDFESDDNDPTDMNGHGTHVAGTVAAVGNNGLGVVGMSWGAQVMAVRGLDAQGYGWGSDLAKAILYAAENGADVISNSWIGFRGSVRPDAVTDAVATARALGAVVVAAAGNSGVDLRIGGFPASMYHPAGVEGVITVSASDSDDEVASFSNYGRDVSVSAPGVDVLSLKGAHSGNVGGETVGGDYLRLSGTSMAAPHVSGLAALLLSAFPSLTLDEVQWHIELNADQPGYPGYEGQLWNPRHGWGRINAAQVFNTPPVTTRIKGRLAPQHAFPDMVVQPYPDTLGLVITTLDPTPWTVTAPAWLQASPVAGTTGGPITLSYDTTGLSPGPQTGSLNFDVPLAVGGGTAAAADLYVHRDERVGPEILLKQVSGSHAGNRVRATSNGVGSLVAWEEPSDRLAAVHVDAAGNPGAPYTLYEGERVHSGPWLATDGHGYVVAWNTEVCKRTCSRMEDAVMLMRLDPQGQPLDESPIVVARRKFLSDIAFDGEAYTLLFKKGWGPVSYEVQRLGRDGVLWNKSQRIGRYPPFYPRFACATGTCLMSWSEIIGTTPGGFYIYAVHSVQIVGDRAVDPTPKQGPTNFFHAGSLFSDGTNFLVVGQQHLLCGSGDDETICRVDAVAARMAPDGSPLDAASFPLNYNSPLDTLDTQLWRGTQPSGLAFDGTNYLLPFAVYAYSSSAAPKNIFLARLRPDGTLIDSEDEGLLVRPQWANVDSSVDIAVDALHSLVVFREGPDYSEYSVRAVPMLARSADPSFAPAAIGAIGALGVDEGEFLKLALAAPGLDPDNTTFTVAGLPSDAHLDAATGLFAWRPNGAQGGTYSAHFEATDGGELASEDVTVTVGEASLSISGTARLASDGSPASGLALRLSGVPKRQLTGHTDIQGRFRFDDLISDRRYRLRLTRPSTREYRTNPRAMRVTLGASDIAGLDLEVSPK